MITQSSFYFDLIDSIIKDCKSEIECCDKDLECFAIIYKRKIENSEDTTIDLDIKSKIIQRKKDAENELKYISKRILNLQPNNSGTAVQTGTCSERGTPRTKNIDPSILE